MLLGVRNVSMRIGGKLTNQGGTSEAGLTAKVEVGFVTEVQGSYRRTERGMLAR